MVELDRPDEVAELVELRRRLAGEADDERRPQGDPGQAFAQAEEQPLVAGARAGAAHALQHRVGAVLERQVDVLDDLARRGDGVDGLVGDGRRVEIEQPHPAEAVDAIELAQQAGEGAALAPIDAEEGGVLRDQEQLADAAVGELRAPRPRSIRPSGCGTGPRSFGMMQKAQL